MFSAIIVLIVYFTIGYLFSVLIHAALTNEWSFFISYGEKETKLTEAEIEEVADYVIIFWPLAILFLAKDKALKFRSKLAKTFGRKK